MKTKSVFILLVIAGLLLIADKSDCQENTSAKIFKSGDGYTVRVDKPGMVFINVYMEKNGRQYFVGQKPFRVRYLPSPYPAIAGKRGGKINKNFLQEVGRLTAILENVDFDVNYQITSYKFTAKDGDFSKGQNCKGNKFDCKVQKLLNHSKRGDKVYFEDIKAVGPDKVTRNIGSLVFTID